MANVAGLRQPGKPRASAGARVLAVVMLRGCSRCGHGRPFPFAALGAFKSIVNPCSTALKHSRGRRRRWQQSSDGFGHGQGRGAGSGAPARGSWVRSPFSHPKPRARPQPSRAPGNAEELWVCSTPPTQLRPEEKLSWWRLIPPAPLRVLFILTI